jgi:hypothetical protein
MAVNHFSLKMPHNSVLITANEVVDMFRSGSLMTIYIHLCSCSFEGIIDAKTPSNDGESNTGLVPPTLRVVVACPFPDGFCENGST